MNVMDHPRSRGVYITLNLDNCVTEGSSPLARGLLSRQETVDEYAGIIPARAGFTPIAPQTRTRAWDHPRSRGVYPPLSPGFSSTPGSSPLARGLRPRPAHDPERLRIIPARAGFTDAVKTKVVKIWDHPRSRGVYKQVQAYAGNLSGSSPLARGLPVHSDLVNILAGIIPARAGFTPVFHN